MKDTIKNSIIGAFALFGLFAIITGATYQQTANETTFGTPESHVWQFHIGGSRPYTNAFAIIISQTHIVNNYTIMQNARDGLKYDNC